MSSKKSGDQEEKSGIVLVVSRARIAKRNKKPNGKTMKIPEHSLPPGIIPDPLRKSIKEFKTVLYTFDPRCSSLAEMLVICEAGLSSIHKIVEIMPDTKDSATACLAMEMSQMVYHMIYIAYIALTDWLPLVVSNETAAVQASCANAVANFVQKMRNATFANRPATDREEQEVAAMRSQARDITNRRISFRRRDAWEKIAQFTMLACATDEDRRKEYEEGDRSIVARNELARDAAAILCEALHDFKPTEEEEKSEICAIARSIITSYTEGDRFGKVKFADQKIPKTIAMYHKITSYCHQALTCLCTTWEKESARVKRFIDRM
jgi:hypothetical protein